MRPSEIFTASFFDGFTMAGLSGKLRRPGSPTQLFADPEPSEVEEDIFQHPRNRERSAIYADIPRSAPLKTREG
jgi:hypothetical protein